MDLLRFNFQNKKMVNLNFWLGHCFDYCTTKLNILRFSILREMEINFFYFIIQLCFCTCHAIKFSSVRYSKSSCSVLFSISIHIFRNKILFASIFRMFLVVWKKCLNLVYVFPVFSLWTLNYVDCVPFSCIDHIHKAHNQAK